MMLSLPFGWLKNTNKDQWMSQVLCWRDWRGELTVCRERKQMGGIKEILHLKINSGVAYPPTCFHTCMTFFKGIKGVFKTSLILVVHFQVITMKEQKLSNFKMKLKLLEFIHIQDFSRLHLWFSNSWFHKLAEPVQSLGNQIRKRIWFLQIHWGSPSEILSTNSISQILWGLRRRV